MISKIALGTVQFGLDYGINNTRGKVPFEEVSKILQYCGETGIDLLDTAIAYGSSEKIIGEVQQKSGFSFKLVSKLPHGKELDVSELVSQSCKNLKSESLYGFLFHSYSDYKENPRLFDELTEIKKSGKIKKIGFSLYNPEEAEKLLEKRIEFDLVQVPYSIFDQRFENVFNNLKQNGVEIHTRSTFLQGLFFKDAENLPVHFSPVSDKLKKLQNLFSSKQIPLACGLLNFALLNEKIDKIVIGIDGIDNLKENLKALDYLEQTRAIYGDLRGFKEETLEIILPTLWKNIA